MTSAPAGFGGSNSESRDCPRAEFLLHGPHATSFLFAGGNLRTGRVIGRTDRLGEYVSDRRIGVGDFAATVYRHLGIDHEHTTITDPTGRPIPILPEGRPIAELMG